MIPEQSHFKNDILFYEMIAELLFPPPHDLQVSLCVAWTWHCQLMPGYSGTSFAFVTTLSTSSRGVCRSCCSGWKSKLTKHLWTSSPQTWWLVTTLFQLLSSSTLLNMWKHSGNTCHVAPSAAAASSSVVYWRLANSFEVHYCRLLDWSVEQNYIKFSC